MKNTINSGWRMSLAFLASLVGASWAVFAQDSENSAEEVFELSPFAVDASGDTGYRATSTIAGSRLNTQLRDVAASVTVLTDEFLDDLGATDLAHGLSMNTSMRELILVPNAIASPIVLTEGELYINLNN
ncbi:MAG: hypothetical protein P8L44_11905 [Opitutales bacterium]|nr:hypothetical protein [Opitutales bacterium]